MRTLGLDYGSKTVGVAVTDPLGLTAQGVEIIRRQKENHLRKTYQRIKELCEQYDVEKIVLGLPLNMDDTMGDRAEKTLEFKKELERRLSVPVLLGHRDHGRCRNKGQRTGKIRGYDRRDDHSAGLYEFY